MTASELLEKLQALVDAGHGEEQVYLDTNPHDLCTVGEIGIDADGLGVIIWSA